VSRAWYEIWIPPIVTVLGWVALVWLNQWNNRDLVQLQKKDLATNRILDALDLYLEYLDDVGSPYNLFWRDGVLSQKTTLQRSDERGLLVTSDTMSLALASLSISDTRRRRWIDILHREAWTYNKRQGIPEQVEALEKSHKIILSDLAEFQTKQLAAHTAAHTKEGSSPSDPFILVRDEPSLQHIKQQRHAVLVLYTNLSSSGSSGSHEPTKKDLDATISRPSEKDIHTEDTAS
jgi:hypothetical protein